MRNYFLITLCFLMFLACNNPFSKEAKICKDYSLIINELSPNIVKYLESSTEKKDTSGCEKGAFTYSDYHPIYLVNEDVQKLISPLFALKDVEWVMITYQNEKVEYNLFNSMKEYCSVYNPFPKETELIAYYDNIGYYKIETASGKKCDYITWNKMIDNKYMFDIQIYLKSSNGK